MPSGSNDVDIVVGLKASTYTQGIKEIKKGLSDLDSQTKEWSSHTVTNSQAASAGIRLMENPLGNQLRALEKLISTSKVLSSVFQAAFPVVGAVAAGTMLFKLGNDVAEFIKKTQEMPRSLELGFRALNQSAMQADDMIKVANDRLDDQIAKLEHKPTRNGAALALDEARVAADKYAEALGNASKSFAQVVKENESGVWDAVSGNGSTAGVANSGNLYNKKMEDLGSQKAIALHDGDKGLSADLGKQMADLTNAERDRLKADIAMRTGTQSFTQGDTGEVSKLSYAQINGDQTKPLTIDRAALMHLNLSGETQTDEAANGKKQGQVVDAQTAADNARKAAEAARKIIEDTVKAWDQDLEIFKKWQEYSANNTKISGDDYRDREKNNFLSTDDNNQLNQSGNGSAARIDAMRQSIDVNKENSDLIAQQALDMQLATGQISRMDAARQQATIHTQQYTATLQKLKDQADYIKGDKSYTSEEARQAALINNQTAQGQLNVNRQIQVSVDSQSTNPAATSGLVGAADALNEFTIAARDSAAQVREFTTSTINGFNDTLLKVLTTPRETGLQTRQALGNYGAGLFRGVAGIGLQHAEAPVTAAVGKLFGSAAKLGTLSNPMFVKSVDSLTPGSSSSGSTGGGGFGGILGKLGGGIKGLFSGNSQGSGYDGLDAAQGIAAGGGAVDAGTDLSGVLTGILPMLASGGPINGPAIVGEQGPELFVPGNSGTIIPNHKLFSSNNGSGTTIHIDASNSVDPAQTRAQVMQGIQRAAPQLTANAVHATKELQRRSPTSAKR